MTSTLDKDDPFFYSAATHRNESIGKLDFVSHGSGDDWEDERCTNQVHRHSPAIYVMPGIVIHSEDCVEYVEIRVMTKMKKKAMKSKLT